MYVFCLSFVQGYTDRDYGTMTGSYDSGTRRPLFQFNAPSAASGLSACFACPVGKFREPLTAVCTNCLAGTFSSTSGVSVCQSCPAGKVAPDAGQSQCASCASGRFISTGGKLVCDHCATVNQRGSAHTWNTPVNVIDH